MYCPSFEVDPMKFCDVATLAQVKTTHAIHTKMSVGEMEDNVWYIPSFPIVREDSCKFRLYSHSVDDASNRGNAGNDADLEQDEKEQKHHYTFMATTGPISLTLNIVPTGIHIGLIFMQFFARFSPSVCKIQQEPAMPSYSAVTTYVDNYSLQTTTNPAT